MNCSEFYKPDNPYLTQYEVKRGMAKANDLFQQLMKAEKDDHITNLWHDYYTVLRSYHLLPSENEWKMIWSFSAIRADLEVKWRDMYSKLRGKFGMPAKQLKECDTLPAGSWAKNEPFEKFEGFPEGYILQKDDGTVLIRAEKGWISCAMEEIADIMENQFDVKVPKWGEFKWGEDPKPEVVRKEKVGIDAGTYYAPYVPEEKKEPTEEERYEEAMNLLLDDPLK